MIPMPHVPEGDDTRDLPRSGIIGAELQMLNENGTTLLEFVLPDRFPGGPEVPFRTNTWRLDPGRGTPLDIHPMHEMWFIARGEADFRLGDQTLRIREGQAVFIPSQVPHQATSTGTEPLVGFAVWWDPR